MTILRMQRLSNDFDIILKRLKNKGLLHLKYGIVLFHI
jgi:hypothetical protein